ncbi:Helix-destabilizing protein [uncultured Clostridium sp.]|uniref:single-stranded DNA-binding protein n=1 Tax=uncultured Clostridium sp. TaxID=59620 RepID=UPI0008227BF8|nr:single-stranded DNA-binding protein [uncultured Clostridium sp.]SCJ95944.1 Helix-destabilizing protein [uncultured Clostridium sp.]
MNSCVMVGRLTKDVEFRVNGDKSTAKFTIAVNREYKNAQGNYDADFINCTAFGKRAETIQKYFAKRRQVCVKGPWRTGSYDAQDGTKRYTNELVVEGFTFIGGQANSGNSNNVENNTLNNNNDFGYEEPIDDGDMPF